MKATVKLIVDKMPMFLDECPFFDCDDCRLLGCSCERADQAFRERDIHECAGLIELNWFLSKEVKL